MRACLAAAAAVVVLLVPACAGGRDVSAGRDAEFAPVLVVRAPTAAAWVKLLRATGAAARVGPFGAGAAVVLPAGSGVPASAVAHFVRRGGRVVTADRGTLEALGVRFGAARRIDGLDGGIRFAAPHVAVPLLGTNALLRAGGTVFAGTIHGGRVLALGVDPLAAPLQGYELMPSLGALTVRVLRAPPGPVREASEVYLDPGSTPGLSPEALAARLGSARVAYVAGWNYAFLDRSFDYPYGRLIDALHARGIQAYAWLEPPMVGLGLWAAHPECREKTRSGRDAVVDWRSLIALESPACFELAWRVWSGLLKDFDWDGVNVAELYFETGDANRETPFHPSALAEFGGDPSKDPSGFADWRTREVTLLNRELVTRVRALRPELDVELTVIDDQLDPALGRGVGSDVRALAQVAGETGATLQVEDPFTTWAQGPSRYARLNAKVSPLMPRGRSFFDVNVVPRAVGRPTSQMTGGELALSVAAASQTAGAIALYSAATLTSADVATAAAALAGSATTGVGTVSSPWSVTLRSPSPSRATLQLDGVPWPAAGGRALVPAGRHEVQWRPGDDQLPALVRLTGELLSERAAKRELTIRYTARARAWATFDRAPTAVAVDGVPDAGAPSGVVVRLPAGDHTALVRF